MIPAGGASLMMHSSEGGMLFDAWRVLLLTVSGSGGQFWRGVHAGANYAIGAWITADPSGDSDWHTYHSAGTMVTSAAAYPGFPHTWFNGTLDGNVTDRTTNQFFPYVTSANVSPTYPAYLQATLSANRPRPALVRLCRYAAEAAWRIRSAQVHMRSGGLWYRIADQAWDAGDTSTPNDLTTYEPVAV